jgi:hypothetical protein
MKDMFRSIQGSLFRCHAMWVYGKSKRVFKERGGLLFFQMDIHLAIELELDSIDFDGALWMHNDKSYLLLRALIVKIMTNSTFNSFAGEVILFFFEADIEYFVYQVSCEHT